MKKEYKLYALVYISLSDVDGSHLGILQIGDNVSNTQYTIVPKNKVNIDLRFLFLMHLYDGDSCCSFGNTVIE